jgi:hypothetical protein
LKLNSASYEWALKHLSEEGDSDLFPVPFEIDVFNYCWKELLVALNKLDVEQHQWSAGRRFVIPKEALAFRNATQLDLYDSLILSAIIYEFGNAIESHRIPIRDDTVFSCRFDPKMDGRLYGDTSNWDAFWQTSLKQCGQPGIEFVAIADITDFYNQIYHHVLENELAAAKVPPPICQTLMNLLKVLTHRGSRGIPVGPHATRFLAECSLNPVDRLLVLKGRPFCRYMDDFHFFCKSKEDAEYAIYDLAAILDNQGRLTLQSKKTKIIDRETFSKQAQSHLVDRPLNKDEENILRIIRLHGGGDPYAPISLKDLDADELDAMRPEVVEALLELHLAQETVDYSRMGWFVRRLSQVGTPSAVEFLLSNILRVTPILGDVARYLIRAGRYYDGSMPDVGDSIVNALDTGIISRSEYLQLVLINLFSRLPNLNHLGKLTQRYDSAGPAIRREIVLAACAAEDKYWVKERKAEFEAADSWLRRAIIAASRFLPGDEGRIWRRHITPVLVQSEPYVVRWAER